MREHEEAKSSIMITMFVWHQLVIIPARNNVQTRAMTVQMRFSLVTCQTLLVTCQTLLQKKTNNKQQREHGLG